MQHRKEMVLFASYFFSEGCVTTRKKCI